MLLARRSWECVFRCEWNSARSAAEYTDVGEGSMSSPRDTDDILWSLCWIYKVNTLVGGDDGNEGIIIAIMICTYGMIVFSTFETLCGWSVFMKRTIDSRRKKLIVTK
eukprot:PhF_6_TR39683/c0_g1_i11/m.58975